MSLLPLLVGALLHSQPMSARNCPLQTKSLYAQLSVSNENRTECTQTTSNRYSNATQVYAGQTTGRMCKPTMIVVVRNALVVDIIRSILLKGSWPLSFSTSRWCWSYNGHRVVTPKLAMPIATAYLSISQQSSPCSTTQAPLTISPPRTCC